MYKNKLQDRQRSTEQTLIEHATLKPQDQHLTAKRHPGKGNYRQLDQSRNKSSKVYILNSLQQENRHAEL